MNGVGFIAGLTTAGLWTATAVCFETSSRDLGSWAVNVLRLMAATVLFMALSLARTNTLLPPGLTTGMWTSLALSGMVGFVVGDLLLFEAFVKIGARLSMLIYASVPTITAVLGFLFLGESLSRRAIAGMFVTTSGIAIAVLAKNPKSQEPATAARTRRQGFLLALGASAGQSAGLLLSKQGSLGADSFAATQVRVLAGMSGFLLLGMLTRRLRPIAATVRKAVRPVRHASDSVSRETDRLRRALGIMLLGTVLGPFLGVSLGLKSLQLLPSGVASTLMSLVPVLLVPVSALLLGEKIRAREVLGTFVAMAGVVILAF